MKVGAVPWRALKCHPEEKRNEHKVYVFISTTKINEPWSTQFRTQWRRCKTDTFRLTIRIRITIVNPRSNKSMNKGLVRYHRKKLCEFWKYWEDEKREDLHTAVACGNIDKELLKVTPISFLALIKQSTISETMTRLSREGRASHYSTLLCLLTFIGQYL